MSRLVTTNPGRHTAAFEDMLSQAWLDQAGRDAMRHMAQDLPDPADYARWLSEMASVALLRARVGPDGWYVRPDDAALLRPLGLCEAGTSRERYYLGNYGTAVLKALRGLV